MGEPLVWVCLIACVYFTVRWAMDDSRKKKRRLRDERNGLKRKANK